MKTRTSVVEERTEASRRLAAGRTARKRELTLAERFAPAPAIELHCDCDGRHAGMGRRAHREICGTLAVTSERIDSVVVYDLCTHCAAAREIRLRLEPLPAIALEPLTPYYDVRRGAISYGDLGIKNVLLACWLGACVEEIYDSDDNLWFLPDIYRIHEAAGEPRRGQDPYTIATVDYDGSITIYDDDDGKLTSEAEPDESGEPDDPYVVAVARALRARGAGTATIREHSYPAGPPASHPIAPTAAVAGGPPQVIG